MSAGEANDRAHASIAAADRKGLTLFMTWGSRIPLTGSRLTSDAVRPSVYAGTDPLTRREIRLRATARTDTQARIELGKLLEKARDGRNPETAVTVAKLLDEYAAIAQWDVSTRNTTGDSSGGSSSRPSGI